MLGTILIVILILALVGAFPSGRIAETGDITRPEDWVWYSSSFSFSFCSAGFESCSTRLILHMVL